MVSTISNALQEGEQILKSAGIKNYKIEAREILENLLKMSFEEIFVQRDMFLKKQTKELFFKGIYKRKIGEPIQYITKISHFYSRVLHISKGVLIPRPETEILVEKVLEVFAKKKNISCLDMCSGSGCIGISLMLENSNFKQVVFVDKSKKAIDCCRKNLQTYNLLSKSNLILSTFFTKIPDRKFDLICCNPPYVSKNQYLSLENTVKLYEPKNALVSDNGGYSHIKKIAKESTNYLKKDAKIFFEVGIGQAKQAKEILFNLGYSDLVTYNDLNNIERIVAGKWKN